MTATPPTLAVCYTVEEFLPTGVTPQNISDEGLWNAGTLTIKWGPFLDHVPRMFHYDPIGATNHYLASGRISVDGVSHLWNGEVTVQTWLVFGQVELESYVGPASDGQGTRAVTFKATEDDGTLLATWSLPLQFARGTGLRTVGGYTLRNVPSGTTHLSAKTAWSLRKRLTVMLAGESAEANFTESAALPGVDQLAHHQRRAPGVAGKRDADGSDLPAAVGGQARCAGLGYEFERQSAVGEVGAPRAVAAPP